MEDVFEGHIDDASIGLLPPYPRRMGTYVPKAIRDRSFELPEVSFTDRYEDSHTALAVQAALDSGAKEIWFVGYDGYPASMTLKEHDLYLENEYMFRKLEALGIELYSLTLSSYDCLQARSLYESL